MTEEDLIDFANWLWDIGKLKVRTQIPPFEDADKIIKTYIKSRRIEIKDSEKYSKKTCTIRINLYI